MKATTIISSDEEAFSLRLEGSDKETHLIVGLLKEYESINLEKGKLCVKLAATMLPSENAKEAMAELIFYDPVAAESKVK